MQIIPFEQWNKLTAPGMFGRLRRWLWRLGSGPPLPLPVTGGAADWTPIRATRLILDGTPNANQATRFFAGVLVESGAAAGTLTIHDAAGATNAKFTIKVDVANSTRLFPMPGMVMFDTDIYADLDANIASVTILHG